MNTLIYYSINVLVLSVLVFIIGMIKPKWILLWVEKPGRLPVSMIAMILFMIAAVMFGEGNKQLKGETAKPVAQVSQPASEVPVISAADAAKAAAPAPAPESAVSAPSTPAVSAKP